jgi:phosphoribosylformimino-5-aminoimidazole carboxamide ribotide isomerase
MKVIPVIDLKAGAVVHARRGDRDSYQPIVTPLCHGSAPRDVVAGLLSVYPFDTLYIADLAAIQRQGDHLAEIADLAAAFPDLRLWVDNGLGDLAGCRAWLGRGLGTLVLGSEAVSDAGLVRRLRDETAPDRLVLSLDFRGTHFLGPTELADRVDDWPSRLIAMTLSQVGSGAGPDFARVADIKRRAGARQVFAAGGVRGGEDLLELARQGVSGVLVASALHDRRIGPAEIERAAADAGSR